MHDEPEMILGVWISTKPKSLNVSRNSLQTPASTRNIAWLVTVRRSRMRLSNRVSMFTFANSYKQNANYTSLCWFKLFALRHSYDNSKRNLSNLHFWLSPFFHWLNFPTHSDSYKVTDLQSKSNIISRTCTNTFQKRAKTNKHYSNTFCTYFFGSRSWCIFDQ